MQEYAAENASLRQLSRHYASGVISMAEYRVARHALLQALEAGTEAPELPVLEEVLDEPVLATIKQTPFAESGEWQVDATVMTAALTVPPDEAPISSGDGATMPTDKAHQMDANSWTLLVVILVVIVSVALGVLFYVFKL